MAYVKMTSQAVLISLLLLVPAVQGSTSPSTTISTTTLPASSSTATSTESTTTTNPTTTTTFTSTAANVTNMTASNITSTTETTTTTTPTTTTTVKPDMGHNTAIATYVLNLTVSNDNTSDIQYTNANLTMDEIMVKLRNIFQNVSPMTSLTNSSSSSSQGPANYTFTIEFLYGNIVNKTTDIETRLNASLNDLQQQAELTVPNRTLLLQRIRQFLNTTSDDCAAKNICPAGYRCVPDGCDFMCNDTYCSGHGTCYISVMKDGTTAPMCQCDSEYAIEYLGDYCEDSRRGRLQIIAIIAGVLGAACLVFIIVIIVLCLKYNRTSASSNYDVSTASYGNSAYENEK